jgi:hypothetical protein
VKIMSSSNKADKDTSQKLHQLGKSVSYDCLKANSCIELADIRKLDSLLNQCESISCENLLLFDEIYNYDLCSATKRKYLSTSALNRILPKNSIRRRAHKKALGICENDTKIIKLIDDKRAHCESTTKDENDYDGDDKNINNSGDSDDDYENPTDVELTESYVVNQDEILMTQSCTNLMHEQYPTETSSCCDKTIQTSFGELNNSKKSLSTSTTDKNDSCKYLLSDEILCMNSSECPNRISSDKNRKKVKRKRCSCRKYDNKHTICETSLSTPPTTQSKKFLSASIPISSKQPPTKKSLLQLNKKDKSIDKSPGKYGKSNRFTRQQNTVVNDDECPMLPSIEYFESNTNDSGESKVIHINEKSIEIIPISKNSSYSQSLSPKGNSNNHLYLDAKSDKSETQSQKSHKSKRSKFSPSLFSRKLTSRLNSEDDAAGAKESLLGSRGKSSEKKMMPEPVETVCTIFHHEKKENENYFFSISTQILYSFFFLSLSINRSKNDFSF